LREADLSSNPLDDLITVEPLLASAQQLEVLSLRNCPCCDLPKYRDMATLAAGPRLRELDGVEIVPAQRDFLERMQVCETACIDCPAPQCALALEHRGRGVINCMCVHYGTANYPDAPAGSARCTLHHSP
jgi:hypothetical protein